MADKNTFLQALMHMIKGNLGAGILAMPASFAHTGLIGGSIGLPILCLIAAYCVQMLLNSARHFEAKNKGQTFDYASLAKHSFGMGPSWSQNLSRYMSSIVDVILLITQVGVCCVYVVFVVDNIVSILATYNIPVTKSLVFIGVFPVMLLLSFIRTLKRLAIASMIANILQALGLALILEYLIRDLKDYDLSKRDNFMPIKDMALGFGSAMFAFEGISVVLPIYSRLKKPTQMPGFFGVANLSFIIILILYFVVGLFGYLRFGHRVRDSITLNLPAEPLYDAVRAMFTASIVLTYPLQFYVPNEICWRWVRNNLLICPALEANLRQVAPSVEVIVSSDKTKPPQVETVPTLGANHQQQARDKSSSESCKLLRHEYCCRAILVTATFTLAYSVPKLNLLMDLVGSLSGTILSLTFPAIIHLITFSADTRGLAKAVLVLVDGSIILFSLIAGGSGSVISLATILNSFHH